MSKFQLGYNAAVEAIQNGQDPAPVVIAAYMPAKGRAAIAGVLSAFSAAFDLWKQGGFTFTPVPGTSPAAAEIVGAAAWLRVLLLENMLNDLHPPPAKIPPGSPDPDLDRARAAWTALMALCDFVYAAARTEVSRTLTAERLKLRADAPAAPAAAQDTKPPLQVEIVGMPDRITATTVERDGQGDIKETRQVEKDAA